MAGKPGRSGRPTELTPAIAKAIVDDVRGGLAEGRAAIKLGFAPSTVTGWKHKGERDIGAGKGSVYANFAKDLKVADVEFEQTRLALVLWAGRQDKYWGANMQVLRSKYPHWRQGFKVGGDDELPPLMTSELSAADRRARAKRLARMLVDAEGE